MYQCYACEEPIEVAARAEKQRDKITDDLRKFCDPAKGATALLKGHKIKRWILVVPNHDSADVVKHALRKTGEVVAKSLDHVDNGDFQILVHDRASFSEDSWFRSTSRSHLLGGTVQEVTAEEIEALKRGDSSLEQQLRAKLGVRIQDAQALDDAVNDALTAVIEAENAGELLRNMAPDAWEDVARLKQERLRRLRMGARGDATDRLDFEINDLKNKIIQAVPNIDTGWAEKMSFGSVSEWLMRCP